MSLICNKKTRSRKQNIKETCDHLFFTSVIGLRIIIKKTAMGPKKYTNNTAIFYLIQEIWNKNSYDVELYMQVARLKCEKSIVLISDHDWQNNSFV